MAVHSGGGEYEPYARPMNKVWIAGVMAYQRMCLFPMLFCRTSQTRCNRAPCLLGRHNLIIE